MENYIGKLASVMKQYKEVKSKKLKGRYINQSHIAPILEELSDSFKIREIGKSVKGEPVHIVNLGQGETKILAWSQMHGNESTTTKAVFDLIEACRINGSSNPVLKEILKKCSIRIIPMLNPDGARAYTRSNANDVDLNRDAQDLKEEESQLLRTQFEDFQPHFCFNLHDQRTIFSAGKDPKPATLSFLTPASDKDRNVTKDRKKSMQVIVAIHEDLKQVLPGQIGRYDDAFNINCTGDSFQYRGVPTILYEAGHFAGDYSRDQTRKFVFAALVSALAAIADQSFAKFEFNQYFEIPENKKLFNDVILRKALVEGKEVDVAIQFKEELEGERIIFRPVIEKIASEIPKYAHREINCEGKKIELVGGKKIHENDIVEKILLNDAVLTLKNE